MDISPLFLMSATQATQIQSNNIFSRSHVFTLAKWLFVLSRFMDLEYLTNYLNEESLRIVLKS